MHGTMNIKFKDTLFGVIWRWMQKGFPKRR